MIPPEPQNFGFKFPASGSAPVLFSSMVKPLINKMATVKSRLGILAMISMVLEIFASRVATTMCLRFCEQKSPAYHGPKFDHTKNVQTSYFNLFFVPK